MSACTVESHPGISNPANNSSASVGDMVRSSTVSSSLSLFTAGFFVAVVVCACVCVCVCIIGRRDGEKKEGGESGRELEREREIDRREVGEGKPKCSWKVRNTSMQ